MIPGGALVTEIQRTEARFQGERWSHGEIVDMSDMNSECQPSMQKGEIID
jgi:hypothetical protein